MDRKEIIAEQPDFYRNGFRKLLNFMYILFLIVFLLMGWIVYQHKNRPVQKYFVTTSDGRLIEIKPL